MKKSFRIKSGREYRLLRERGRTWVGRYIVLSVLTDLESVSESKAGFITGKRIGNAVFRNKIRRRLRAIVYSRFGEVSGGILFVTIARPACREATFVQLDREWEKLARKARIIE